MGNESQTTNVDPLRRESDNAQDTTFRQEAAVSYSDLINSPSKNEAPKVRSDPPIQNVYNAQNSQAQLNGSANNGSTNNGYSTSGGSPVKPNTQQTNDTNNSPSKQNLSASYKQQRLPYTLTRPLNNQQKQQTRPQQQSLPQQRQQQQQIQNAYRGSYNSGGSQYAYNESQQQAYGRSQSMMQSNTQQQPNYISEQLRDKNLAQLGRLEIKVTDPLQEARQHKIVPGWRDSFTSYNIVAYIINSEDIRREFCTRRRRFRELVSLHEIIKAKYSGYFIPPRPEKNQSNVQDRQNQMEKYLNQLALHPVLCGSKELELFLVLDGELDLNQQWRQMVPLGFLESTQKLFGNAQPQVQPNQGFNQQQQADYYQQDQYNKQNLQNSQLQQSNSQQSYQQQSVNAQVHQQIEANNEQGSSSQVQQKDTLGQINKNLVRGIDLSQLNSQSVFTNRGGFNLQEQLLFKIKGEFEGEKECMSKLEKMSQNLVTVQKEYSHSQGDLGIQFSHIHRSTREHLEIKDEEISKKLQSNSIQKDTNTSQEQQLENQDQEIRFLENFAPEATDSQLGIYKAASEQFLRSQAQQGRTVIRLVEALEAIQNHLAMLPRAIRALEDREKALAVASNHHQQLQLKLQKVFEQEQMAYPFSLQQELKEKAQVQTGSLVSQIRNPQHKQEIGTIETQINFAETYYKKILLRNLEELSRYRFQKNQQLEEMVLKLTETFFDLNNDSVVEWTNLASQMGATKDEIDQNVNSNYRQHQNEGSHVNF